MEYDHVLSNLEDSGLHLVVGIPSEETETLSPGWIRETRKYTKNIFHGQRRALQLVFINCLSTLSLPTLSYKQKFEGFPDFSVMIVVGLKLFKF